MTTSILEVAENVKPDLLSKKMEMNKYASPKQKFSSA
jgi:hypothetical protein